MLRGLVDATALLTRIPVPMRGLDDGQPVRAVPWFPTVGAAVGLGVAGSYAAFRLALPAPAAAVLAVAVGIALTGGFHEDGLADVADAAGGWTVADRRRILDDPRHGTYGVLALILTVAVRVLALAALGPAVATGALVAAHGIGRAAAVGLMAAGPIAGSGLGASYARELRPRHVAIAVATGLAAGAFGLRVWLGAGIALAFLAAFVLRRWARRALDGVTGDVLGACEQATEASILLLAAATTGT